MNRRTLPVLVPGIFAAASLALGISLGAQTSPHAGHTPAAKTPEAPMATEEKMEMKAEMKKGCEAMMAKKQEMQGKLAAMDASLDKLVATMNAAKSSKETDAMEKPMAAVVNELVAQRKTTQAMTREMDAAMMTHMMSHMDMHGTMGEMDCPMMKAGMTH